MKTYLEIVPTQTFTEEAVKLSKSDPSLKKKITTAFEKLKSNPFQGQKVETSDLEDRRIWVGDGHRMFYDVKGNKISILHIRKKDKHTYRT